MEGPLVPLGAATLNNFPGRRGPFGEGFSFDGVRGYNPIAASGRSCGDGIVKKKNKTSAARRSKEKAKTRRGVKAQVKRARDAQSKAQEKPPGAKRPGKKRGPKPGTHLRFNWAGVDWSLRDADIARRLGVSRERVRQVRKGKGLPPSSEIGRHPHDWNAVDWSKTDGEIARRLGMTPQRVGRARRSRGIDRAPQAVVHRAYGWDEAKWR
jgi:hypothetical protein